MINTVAPMAPMNSLMASGIRRQTLDALSANSRSCGGSTSSCSSGPAFGSCTAT